MPPTPDTEIRRLFEDVLGCKWTLAILGALQSGAMRPGSLRRGLPGLTMKVMQQRLRKLEGFGLAQRRLVSAKPLHVEYRLTPKGRELCRVVSGVQRFASKWQ